MTASINIMRHESVFDPSQHPYPVHIIGAGATGSHVFSALVSLGVKNISVYDPDIVEEHNLANQIYTGTDVGAPKVEGCRKHYHHKLGVDTVPSEMRFIPNKVTPSSIHLTGHANGGVVFLLTDTMKSRRDIFDALTAPHISGNAGPDSISVRTACTLIIETRMGSTHGSVYTVNPFDAKARAAWKTTLVDDEDTDAIELSPCGTSLSVGTTASLIANYAVWQMMQFFVDPVGMQPRVDLFFKPTLTITFSAIAA